MAMLTFLIGMSIEDISWNTLGHASTYSIPLTENLQSSGMALSIASENNAYGVLYQNRIEME
jgi:hypothetical protein